MAKKNCREWQSSFFLVAKKIENLFSNIQSNVTKQQYKKRKDFPWKMLMTYIVCCVT